MESNDNCFLYLPLSTRHMTAKRFPFCMEKHQVYYSVCSNIIDKNMFRCMEEGRYV